ncbi:MAG: tetratricopeptide repeat protein, partial [Gammaproteobacteria bacterium]
MKRPMRLLALALAVVWLAGCVTTGDSDVVDPSEVSLKEAAKYNTQLGVAYMRQGKYDLAMQKLKRALQQDSDSAEAHMAMAVLDEQLDRTDDATDHW